MLTALRACEAVACRLSVLKRCLAGAPGEHSGPHSAAAWDAACTQPGANSFSFQRARRALTSSSDAERLQTMPICSSRSISRPAMGEAGMSMQERPPGGSSRATEGSHGWSSNILSLDFLATLPPFPGDDVPRSLLPLRLLALPHDAAWQQQVGAHTRACNTACSAA